MSCSFEVTVWFSKSLATENVLHVSFDHLLENFGVDTEALEKPASMWVFRAWLEDWKKEYRKKNNPVPEATLLQKYENLVFWDPDPPNNV